VIKAKKRTRVLLVDDNASITRFLIINLEHHGFEAPVVVSVDLAEEMAGHTKVDAVALSSQNLAATPKDISRLRTAFGCPILAYGPGAVAGDGKLRADKCIIHFEDPDGFLQAVAAAIANKSKTGIAG